MGYINVEMYDALIAAGSPEDKAKAAAGSIPADEYLETKEDIAGVKTEIANLRADMHRTAWVMGVGIVVLLSILNRLLA